MVVTPDAQAAMAPGQGKTEKIQGSIPAPDSNGMVPLNAMGRAAPWFVRRRLWQYAAGVHWEGSLAGLLDNVTTRLGLSWRYEQGRISISMSIHAPSPSCLWIRKQRLAPKSLVGPQPHQAPPAAAVVAVSLVM
ncbi:hypothetical protein [Yersinia similis]|uniref:hypothetical protein n=1 Tax=Yersinia similis TaxID=367190 RepID=UPI0004AE9C79|nr:hypothetical protein [Yersinia similis]